MTFNLHIAGKVLEIHSIYDEVGQLCLPYCCDDAAEVVLSISPEDIDYERIHGGRGSASYLETLAVYRKIAEYMIDANTLLMHGSVVETDGRGYMFTADSGVGKTTRTRMWLREFPDSIIVNGDKPLIRVDSDSVWACGTPWCGKEHLQTDTQAPLSAVFFLERAEENSVELVRFADAVPELLRHLYRPKEPAAMAQTLRLLRQFDGKLRFFRFRSNLDPSAVVLAYETAKKYEMR